MDLWLDLYRSWWLLVRPWSQVFPSGSLRLRHTVDDHDDLVHLLQDIPDKQQGDLGFLACHQLCDLVRSPWRLLHDDDGAAGLRSPVGDGRLLPRNPAKYSLAVRLPQHVNLLEHLLGLCGHWRRFMLL